MSPGNGVTGCHLCRQSFQTGTLCANGFAARRLRRRSVTSGDAQTPAALTGPRHWVGPRREPRPGTWSGCWRRGEGLGDPRAQERARRHQRGLRAAAEAAPLGSGWLGWQAKRHFSGRRPPAGQRATGCPVEMAFLCSKIMATRTLLDQADFLRNGRVRHTSHLSGVQTVSPGVRRRGHHFSTSSALGQRAARSPAVPCCVHLPGTL